MSLMAALVVLSACSEPEPTSKTAASQSPPLATIDAPAATGKVVSTLEYTYRAPEGWDAEPTGSQPGTGRTDRLDTQTWRVADGRLADGVSVVRVNSAPPDDDLGLQEELSVNALRDEGATDVTILPRIEVDGAPASAIRAKKSPSAGGPALPLLQYALVHDGRVYIVSFVFSSITDTEVQEMTAQTVLASWTWSS